MSLVLVSSKTIPIDQRIYQRAVLTCDLAVEYVQWIMEEFFGRRRERVQGPAVLLDMCFCDPMHHRRGAGKQLVEWGCQKADEV